MGGQQAFAGSGGVSPYTYSVEADTSGGASIDAAGLYTAGPTAGSSTVRVTDAALTPIETTVTVTAGATITSSAIYENHVVVAQESPAGSISQCNTGFRMNLGFFSVLGDAPVPIILTARMNLSDTDAIDLQWTGSDDAFQIFRDVAPQDLLNPANFIHETVTCSATNLMTPSADVIFYKVVRKP